eukprot:TRINITY_DN136_c0_g1_i6.p1 TRINITY_DN136_c0_g1~~TRINITY_DN136_c0_g1_i6.p1  ORF type:complete len:1343 (-),score=437.45 TRINITY_DN136_c0_g1_i6:54-4082(-)
MGDEIATEEPQGPVDTDTEVAAAVEEEHVSVDEAEEAGEQPKVDEKEEKKEEDKAQMRFMLMMFKYADVWDVLLLLVATVAAAGNGVTMPLLAYYMGGLVDAFYPIYPTDILPNASDFKDHIKIGVHMGTIMEKVRIIFYLALACFFSTVIYVFLYRVAAIRQSIRMRNKYFKSVISQEIGWSDARHAGELTERVNDVLKIEEALGDKFGAGIAAFCTFICGWAIGISQGWKLGLVIAAATPSIFIIVFGCTAGVKVCTTKSQTALALAGGVAEEVIGCVRTVTSFMLQDVETERYDRFLWESEKANRGKGLSLGLGLGGLLGCCQFINALGFWYGCRLMRKGEMTAGEVTTCFFAIMLGTMAIGTLSPTLQALAEGKGVAGPLFKIIDRKPLINRFSADGSKPQITGNVEFKDVKFSYPTRKKIQVLNGLNLTINQGETVALVGTSGCGKSTTVSLLERLYTPTAGTVTVDGVEIQDINLEYLRSNIGIVGQEPVLFAMSIRDNIALGLSADVESVDFALVEQAAKEANAHKFISNLPHQYDTMVGEKGVQLSGGQKQRIAIARALVRNPKILLLDEATSALDTESERVVQEALDRAAQGRTTIIIAHRLSTVKKAKIVVINKGSVVEQGMHDELMALGGIYYQLVLNQQVAMGKEDGENSQAKQPEESEHRHRRHHHHHNDSQLDPTTLLQVGLATMSEFPLSMKPESPPPEDSSETHEETSDEKEEPAGEKEVEMEKDKLEVITPKEPKYKLSTFQMMWRLFKLMKPNTFSTIVAIVSAIIDGAVFPIAGYISAEAMNTLIEFDGTNNNEIRKDMIKWAFSFIALGVGVWVSHFFEYTFIFYSFEALVRRIRRACFKSILRQDVGWFDLPDNSVGVLTTQLAHDPPDLQGAAGVKISFAAQAYAGLLIAIIIALVACWQLALVIMAILPFFSAARFLKQRFEMTNEAKISKAYEASGTVACEAIEAVRTVVMLGREEKFIDRYRKALRPPVWENIKTSVLVSLSTGFSLTTALVLCAVGFWYGARLFQKGKTDFLGLMMAPTALLFGEKVFSMTLAFAPSFSKAKVAMRNMCHLLDRIPPIDFYAKGLVPEVQAIETISFHNLNFSYPSRPGVQVLNDFSLDIRGNKTYALVGESGCGKSTIMGLIQRYYSPLSGQIRVNGHDITELDLNWLRSQIGIVSQEPVLFGTTIKENIARGRCGEQVSMEEIVNAAKLANAHNFISSLPQGYDTPVGERGMQMSGGQKQRIAIARAMLRNPKILLLDEATSALDTESEKVVQAALDQARKGRTTLVVAHRLSTIQDSDVIVAMSKGQVHEMGTHQELLEKRGIYYNLARAQKL